MMNANPTSNEGSGALVCPDCRATLKRRRTRNPGACELLCGGCGRVFDVCDPDTADRLAQP